MIACDTLRHTDLTRKSLVWVCVLQIWLCAGLHYCTNGHKLLVTSHCTQRRHQYDSTTPRVRLLALLIDCRRRRCLNARRAASSLSESCIQRATAVAPDVDDRDMSDPTDVASDADDSERRTHERGRPCPCTRRRREPCSRFVDVLREALALVRGTCGIGERCGRTGGMRGALGGGERER